MAIPELAHRYAKAAYELAAENKVQDKVFDDLRSLDSVFGSKEGDLHEFLVSPMVTSDERVAIVEKALKDKGLAKEAYDLIILLARNNRLGIYHEVVMAYEAQADLANNVGRGVVRSAAPLGQAERERIESTVEKVLNKKVILTYKVDPSVIGGLVAQVGSYTFDDSIASHLKRMNEDLKRRTV